MDFRETIISSFFFHLILLLVVAALSSYTAGFPGRFDNIVSVNLAPEEDHAPTARSIEQVAKPAPVLPVPSHEAASAPDQAAGNPRVESRATPKPVEKPAADAGQAEIQPPQALPTEGEGNDRLEAYYQFITLHRKVFAQKAGVRVNGLLGEAFKTNTRVFYGGTAIVSLRFDTEGELVGVDVASESSDLKAFLEEIGWYDLPPPASYLGHTVQIEFQVLEGYMSHRIRVF